MMKSPLSRPRRACAIVLSAVSLGALPAGAVVVADSNFSTNLGGLSFDGTAAGNTAAYGTGGPGDGSRALHLIDTTNASGGTNAAVARFSTSTVFNTANAGESEFQVRFDIAVTSLSSAANVSAIPRILVRNTSDLSQGLTIGFGVSSGNNVVLFAAKGDSAVPGAAALSYSFGAYDATTFTNNTTGGYVSIAISLLHGGTTMNVTATQGSTTLFSGNVTGFTSNAFTNSSFNFLAATGQAGTTSLYVDNLFIQTVPEPSGAVFGLIGALGFLRRRR